MRQQSQPGRLDCAMLWVSIGLPEGGHHTDKGKPDWGRAERRLALNTGSDLTHTQQYLTSEKAALLKTQSTEKREPTAYRSQAVT